MVGEWWAGRATAEAGQTVAELGSLGKVAVVRSLAPRGQISSCPAARSQAAVSLGPASWHLRGCKGRTVTTRQLRWIEVDESAHSNGREEKQAATQYAVTNKRLTMLADEQCTCVSFSLRNGICGGVVCLSTAGVVMMDFQRRESLDHRLRWLRKNGTWHMIWSAGHDSWFRRWRRGSTLLA
jgi:hypothetical protein